MVATKVAAHPRVVQLSGGGRRARPVVMMIDTGAKFSVLAEDVMDELGLAPVAATDVRTSMHQVEQRPVYHLVMSLDFTDEYGAEHTAALPLRVIARPPAPKDLPSDMVFRHEGLLGLDFLKAFRLLYDGPTGGFTLTCPALPQLLHKS